MLRVLFLVLAVRNLSVSGDKLYFSYYEDNLAETSSYTSVHLASSFADAIAAKGKGVPSLLDVSPVFIAWSSTPSLRPDWKTAWSQTALIAEPLLQDGTLLGFNLGDELVWNGLPFDKLTLVADSVRSRFPRGEAIIWYNDYAGALDAAKDSSGRPVPYILPSALDWFSVDIYHSNGPDDSFVDDVKALYCRRIFPQLAPGQRVVLVPGAFSSNMNHYPNGTYICDRSCYEEMVTKDAYNFAAWAWADSRVVGIFPWNWGGCPTCNGSEWTPPHTCCMDEIGAKDLAMLKAAYREIASRFTKRNRSTRQTRPVKLLDQTTAAKVSTSTICTRQARAKFLDAPRMKGLESTTTLQVVPKPLDQTTGGKWGM